MSNNTGCNVLLKTASKGLSTKLREYLQGHGTATRVFSGIKEAKQLVQDLARPILLIEFSEEKATCDSLVEELIANNILHQYPLVFFGQNLFDYENKLSASFKLATGFQKPISNSELLEAVKYVAESFSFPESSTRSSKVNIRKEGSSGAFSTSEDVNEKTSATFIGISETESAHEIYKSFNSIPQVFFNQLNELCLHNKNLRGKEYALLVKLKNFKDLNHLPKNKEAQKILEQISESTPHWGIGKIHRICYMADVIFDALEMSPSLIEDAKIAALLYNWTIATDNKNLLRKDYLTNRSRSIRKDVCSRVKDSAMKIILELKLPLAGDIVAKTARLIGKEEQVADDEIFIAASIIATLDMVDRACWQSNYFNTRAAYKIMTMAKSGELADTHPAALCCIIKILAEAITSNSKVFLIPKKDKTNPLLRQAAKEAQETVIRSDEQRVNIGDLTPGMKLSRPLVTFDGRELLEEDLTLDQDLIWRIWQLALVRPLNSPHVITKVKERDNV